MPTEPNGWNEWSRHVLKELERLSDSQDIFRDKLEQFRAEMAVIKAKIAFIGGAAGFIVGGAVSILIKLIAK